ncbi:hypothetical protein Taro_021021 [Colocasia esculenta]|uniref:Uncharacterized protein n=1 Tax=Colocasia esculenta TaxID=4460 RepID=A0A843UXW2_COLES|nr:hypothetical protein [Colocasia esculenta]
MGFNRPISDRRSWATSRLCLQTSHTRERCSTACFASGTYLSYRGITAWNILANGTYFSCRGITAWIFLCCITSGTYLNCRKLRRLQLQMLLNSTFDPHVGHLLDNLLQRLPSSPSRPHDGYNRPRSPSALAFVFLIFCSGGPHRSVRIYEDDTAFMAEMTPEQVAALKRSGF